MMLVAFASTCLAMALLASGMYRHRKDHAFALLRRIGTPPLRLCAGYLWLLFAFFLLNTVASWSLALVQWFGLLSAASVLVMLMSAFGKKG